MSDDPANDRDGPSVFLAAATGTVARRKGRSGFGWFILSALFGPLALILLLFLPRKRNRVQVPDEPEEDRLSTFIAKLAFAIAGAMVFIALGMIMIAVGIQRGSQNAPAPMGSHNVPAPIKASAARPCGDRVRATSEIPAACHPVPQDHRHKRPAPPRPPAPRDSPATQGGTLSP